ncbi:MAG: hypothetical protein H7258_05795 [Ferruginibacter sp.]|nr:hypothetical protein [Ferruginibacter sp.]
MRDAGRCQFNASCNAGCLDTSLVTLGFNPPVIANAGNDDDAEYNVSYQLFGCNGMRYQWTPLPG